MPCILKPGAASMPLRVAGKISWLLLMSCKRAAMAVDCSPNDVPRATTPVGWVDIDLGTGHISYTFHARLRQAAAWVLPTEFA